MKLFLSLTASPSNPRIPITISPDETSVEGLKELISKESKVRVLCLVYKLIMVCLVHKLIMNHRFCAYDSNVDAYFSLFILVSFASLQFVDRFH